MILFAILLYLFFPEVFSLSSILKIIVILIIWDIFCAVIRVKNKSFNREVKRHIDKQYEKFFFDADTEHRLLTIMAQSSPNI